MSKLRAGLAAKVVAVVLIVASLGVGIASGIGVAALAGEDLYRDNLTYYDTSWCRSWANSYAWRVIEWYHEGVGQEEMDDWFSQEHTNFAFTLSPIDRPNQILLQNDAAEAAGISGELRGGWEVEDTYLVRWQVRSPITAQDDFYESYRAFQLLYPMRQSLIVFLCVSAVVFLAALIFLFAAAGHRRGTDGITLNLMDKLPLDFYAVAVAIAAVFLILVPAELLPYYRYWEIIILVVCIVAAFMIFLAFCLSLATRIKVGKWWRNSISWRLCAWCGRILSRIWHWFWSLIKGLVGGLPLIWKTALAFGAATLLNAFLCAVMFSSYSQGAGFFLFFIFNFALFCGVCYLAMSLQRLQRAGRRLAAGELDFKVDTKMMFRDFKEHGENLNSIAQGMSAAVDQRMRSERLKTELITNVSHDIKTPLTSIINYVDLLGHEHLEGKAAEYLEVLDRQARRLGKLTEDLVEASKASTGNLSVSLERTGVCEILRQALGEYEEKLEAGRLEAVVSAPADEVYVLADGRLLWRVVDNLLSNVSKYALAGTRVYLLVERSGSEIVIAVKNISRDRLGVDADELMERFVRGDAARSSEGSGLGLNIARSLTELMQGSFSLVVDGDLFKAEIRLRELA